MIILILTHDIPPYCGGAEHVAWYQAKYMAKKDIIHIFTFGHNSNSFKKDNIQILILPRKGHNTSYYMTIGGCGTK